MLFPGLIIFIFLVIIRPQDFFGDLIGLPLVYVVMCAELVLWFVSDVERRLFVTSHDKYFGLFFLAMMVSTLSVGWLGYTSQIAVETMKVAVMYWLTVTIINEEQKLTTATWTTVTLMTVVAAMGVLQHYGWDITKSGMYWSGDKQTWQIRGVGLFDNPNDLAYSVVLVVPFATGLFLSGTTFFRRVCGLCMLVIAGYCIYLTKSRGGYLSAFVCVATWVFCWISNQAVRRAAFIMALLAVIVAFGIQTKHYREDKSSMGRVEAWADGMDMLKQHPLIGIGKGQFLEYHERDSHSSYVRAGAELGLFGLFAFTGILVSSFRTLRSGNMGSFGDKSKVLTAGFTSYLSSYAVGSIFSTRTYDIIFMIVIAFTSVMARISMSKSGVAGAGESALYAEMNGKKVLSLTLLTLVVWKLFLIQVW